MRHPIRLAALLGALAVSAVPARAQPADSTLAGDWRAYPAYNQVTAVTAGFGRVWAGTPGGLFAYDPASGEIERTTTIDGLRGGTLRALTVDERRGVVWAGYADGAIDRLTVADGTVRTFLDIQRNTQFSSRGVRRLLVRGDSLYVATDFGVVVFDAERGEVRNTYARLGTLLAGTPVNDVVFAPLPDSRGGEMDAGIWLATDAGVVRAPAASATLQSPTVWTVEPAFGQIAFSLAYYAPDASPPALYVGGGPTGSHDLYRREDNGTYSRQIFINDDLTALVPDGDRLLAVSRFFVRAFRPGVPTTTFSGAGAGSFSSIAVGPDGRRWAGDAALGLFALPDVPDDGNPVAFTPEPVLPDGPFTNSIAGLDVAPDGTVWVATRRLDAAQTSAVSSLDVDTGAWSSRLTRDEPGVLGSNEFESTVVGPDGTVYVGTVADGLVVIAPDGTTTRYDETNSSLVPAAPPSYVVVSAVAFEGDRRWVVSREAFQSLNLFAADGTWTALPYPAGTSGGQSVRPALAVDRLGQKWLAVGNGGLIVWDTGANPADPADDRARQYRGQGAGGNGLPSPVVTDVVVDGDGVVWIGTTRGLAVVFQSGSVFSADAGLGLPQWTVPPPPNTDRTYFLRDVTVNDLDVDPSGRVWVATSSGAYLVSSAAEGSGFVAARTLNAATSPLPSDEVFRIAVRPGDGRVFLTTAEGLFSVSGDATEPVAGSETLRSSPSPFRPSDAPDGVLVSGLASARSTVRVLTLAGDLVYESSERGGTFRWNGRDARTGDLVSSGVYLVTAVDDEGRSVVGKIAVIR